MATESLRPILTAHLYPNIEAKLIDLLRSLTSEEWEGQTIVNPWKVKDVSAHLLDTQLRKLSMARDGYFSSSSNLGSNEELVAFINRLNSEGVTIYRRLSPQVLISLMEIASRESAEFHQSLDPFASSLFAGVSWAGEKESQNWFDTAREITERWHHQQQIRLAVNKPGIMIRELYHPVLDAFMRALPFHYRAVNCEAGTMIQFNVSGDCGGSWYLYRKNDAWTLVESPVGAKIAEVTIPQEIAWRIFTKGIGHETAQTQTRIDGDPRVGSHILSMVSIVG